MNDLEMPESVPEGWTYFPWGIEENALIEAVFSEDKEEMGLSVIEAKALYEEVRRLAEQDDAHQPVLSALSGHDLIKSPIRKAVLLAVGPIAGSADDILAPMSGVARGCRIGNSDDWSVWRRRVLISTVQLVLFVCTLEHLIARSGITRDEFKIYAQDPRFKATDKELLNELGIEVLSIPEAEQTINYETFVYAPHMATPWGLNSMTRCPQHLAAIYIGFGIDRVIDFFTHLLKHYCDRDSVNSPWQHGRLIAYKKNYMVFPVTQGQTGLEEEVHSGTLVHIRRKPLTADDLKQPCNSSCNSVAVAPPDRIRPAQ